MKQSVKVLIANNISSLLIFDKSSSLRQQSYLPRTSFLAKLTDPLIIILFVLFVLFVMAPLFVLLIMAPLFVSVKGEVVLFVFVFILCELLILLILLFFALLTTPNCFSSCCFSCCCCCCFNSINSSFIILFSSFNFDNSSIIGLISFGSTNFFLQDLIRCLSKLCLRVKQITH